LPFVPDVAANVPEVPRVQSDLRVALKELKVLSKDDAKKDTLLEFTPSSSYDPIKVRISFPGGRGVAALEGHVMDLEGELHEELRTAINYLNLELGLFRFYVGDMPGERRAVFVRHDVLSSTQAPAVHARELRQALTGLCAQKAIFAEPLKRAQEGAPWKGVQQALRALK
jgi:hypothetical protein